MNGRLLFCLFIGKWRQDVELGNEVDVQVKFGGDKSFVYERNFEDHLQYLNSTLDLPWALRQSTSPETQPALRVAEDSWRLPMLGDHSFFCKIPFLPSYRPGGSVLGSLRCCWNEMKESIMLHEHSLWKSSMSILTTAKFQVAASSSAFHLTPCSRVPFPAKPTLLSANLSLLLLFHHSIYTAHGTPPRKVDKRRNQSMETSNR